MSGEREQVDIKRGHIDRNLTRGLRGVRMRQNAVFVCDAGNLRDRLDRADLVIRMHNAHQDRIPGDGALEIIWIEKAVAVDGQVGDLRAETFQEPAGLDGGRMLDLCRHNMGVAFPAREISAL